MVISPHGGTEAKHNLAGSHISCKPLAVYSWEYLRVKRTGLNMSGAEPSLFHTSSLYPAQSVVVKRRRVTYVGTAGRVGSVGVELRYEKNVYRFHRRA